MCNYLAILDREWRGPEKRAIELTFLLFTTMHSMICNYQTCRKKWIHFTLWRYYTDNTEKYGGKPFNSYAWWQPLYHEHRAPVCFSISFKCWSNIKAFWSFLADLQARNGFERIEGGRTEREERVIGVFILSYHFPSMAASSFSVSSGSAVQEKKPNIGMSLWVRTRRPYLKSAL